MKLFKRTAFVLCMTCIISIISMRSFAAVLTLPDNVTEGINYIDDNTVVLVLLAPKKGTVEVTGTFNNWGLLEMNKTPDGDRFWIEIDGLIPGQEYIYQYLVDGTIRIADPFAEKILDPWNDKHIPDAVYPDLIQYADEDKGLASVFQTNQEEYKWQVPNFKGPLKHHLIIYELLIRDFTAEHSFQSIIDSIQYLKNLGINAIELLPVNEFDGNISWGYNPAFYFAVDKYYGTKNKLKELIDVAHQNGIAVILDMVYNHSMNSSPLVSLYWDSNNNRPAHDNPWYNAEAPHTCIGWGNDFNHESQYTRDFFDRVNKFWIEEFKIDGYRYDFTKGFTQKYTASRWENDEDCGASEYDTSRIYNIKRMADKVWEVKDDAYIILEHWAPDEEDELTSYGNGMLTWKRVDGQYKEVISGNKLDDEYFNGAQTDSRVVFMESHDENRIMVQNHKHGASNSDGSYNIKNTTIGLDRVAAGAAFLYTVPGPKMIWMFGEQGYDYDINYCIDDGGESEECRTGPKPLVWTEYMQNPDRADLYRVISELIKLRTENEAFTHGYFTMDGIGAIRQIKITHDSMDVLIMGNFDVYTQTVTDPMFSKEGTWYNYFSGIEYEYSTGNEYVLASGQWELFTSEPIPDTVKAPTNLNASKIDVNDISVTWIDNSNNEIAFQLQRSTSPDSDFVTIDTLPENATSFIDYDLADGTYYYKVRAVGADGNTSDFSNTDDERIGQIQPFVVHFKNTDNWSDVKIYLYDWVANAALPGWTWSGEYMEQEQSAQWYKYTIDEDVQVGIVFNNGGTLKSVDLTRTTEGWYDFGTGDWSDACPGDCPTNEPPVLTVNPAGGTYEGSVTVTLSATNNGQITYTTDSTDPRAGALLTNHPILIAEDTRLRAIAQNQYGYSNEIDEYYDITIPQCDTIFYYNANNWSSVKIYLFNANGDALPGWYWPGVDMTRLGTSNWYYFVNCETIDVGIVFNDGGENQTDDLYANAGWYYSDGNWYSSCPGNCPGGTSGLTLHNKKPASSSTVIIVNNNSSPQTGDLVGISTESWDIIGCVSAPHKSGEVAASTLSKSSLSPYPNPFTDEMNIAVEEENVQVGIQVLDLSGKVHYSTIQNAANSVITINPELNAGVYIMQLSTLNGFTVHKIVKQ